MPPRKRADPKSKCPLSCCTVSEEAKQHIAESAARWKPGLWAEENNYGPACRCGLKTNPMTVGHGVDDGRCPRHGTGERRD